MDEFEQRLNQILGDSDAMAQIAALANSIGAGMPQEEAGTGSDPPAAPFPDENLLKSLTPLLAQMQGGSGKEEALLSAIRPYVSDRNKGKVDRAVRAARISHMAGIALKSFEGQLKL